MELHTVITFAAPPDAVAAMLGDGTFWERAGERVGALENSVAVEGPAVTLTRTFASPSAVERFVGPTLHMTEVITWEGLEATHVATVTGVPATYHGKIVVTAHGETSSSATYQGVLKVAIPLLGAVLEAQAAPLVIDSVELTEEVGAEYLADRA
ncbi:MAG: DUF2505 domain-containing protein [Propionibacteriaceae bacterium]|jgi:hypothetical protein|nr:DUF2505 domain-containing protein [Micropruina sp.]HBX82923.1 hypothetical protein [Propionibacteriaceae bacterium]HBY23524.1 hypothetical protein [Propionibacteriaceae bacterium]